MGIAQQTMRGVARPLVPIVDDWEEMRRYSDVLWLSGLALSDGADDGGRGWRPADDQTNSAEADVLRLRRG